MTNPDANKEVKVELPGGIKAEAKGYHLGNILQLVLAAVATAGAMILYDLRTELKTSSDTQHKAVKEEHTQIRQAIEKSAEAQDEMNFILTLTPEERQRLNMDMPESLRRKVSRTDGRGPR